MMVEIVVVAGEVPPGAVVTGYAISAERPDRTSIRRCEPTVCTRIYHGYGKVRAETGIAPDRGFGDLIGGAEVSSSEMSKGNYLWLRVRD